MSRDVVIMGAAETDIGKLPTTSTLELHVEGARRAPSDAGIGKEQVDGIASVSVPGPIQVAHSLGITPTYIDGTGVGGSSFLFHVRHATAAIEAGYADVVLVTHGESGRSRVGAPTHPRATDSVMAQFEMPYGDHRSADELHRARAPLPARDRQHPRAARRGRGRPAALVLPQPPGDVPR